MRKLFGTDGIRGIAGKYPLDSTTVNKIGIAAAEVLKNRASKNSPVLIGRDTRESGAEISKELAMGLKKEGIEVWDVGIIPTPGIAYLVKKYPAITGIVVSASHNPYEYNGIKFFSHKGIKLSDSVEYRIEQKLEDISRGNFRTAAKEKKIKVKRKLAQEYSDFLKSTLPEGVSFKGFKIVLDCANGATYAVAPKLFRSLGAEIIAINVKPDGKNINKDCGSLHPEKLAKGVISKKADCGIAFDGDGDRAIFCDEKGVIRDGDYILTLLARHLKKKGKLKNNILVTTVMANIGLFKAMKNSGIKTLQTPVGDRYVYEKMMETKSIVGGEQSGHIIFREILPTGDGMLTAAQVLSVMKQSKMPLSGLCAPMKKYPQVLLNTPVLSKIPIDSLPKTLKLIESSQNKLKLDGRVLVRYSGTENLLRVMIEGINKKEISDMAKSIVGTARKEIAGLSV